MKADNTRVIKKGALESFLTDHPKLAWVNVKGDSMTTDNGTSIPDGAKILMQMLPNDPFAIPIGKPVVIMGETNGKPFLVCKLITFVDLVYNRVKCESLNKKYQPFWMPLSAVTSIYEVKDVDIS